MQLPEAVLATKLIGDASIKGMTWLTRGPNCKESIHNQILKLENLKRQRCAGKAKKVHQKEINFILAFKKRACITIRIACQSKVKEFTVRGSPEDHIADKIMKI